MKNLLLVILFFSLTFITASAKENLISVEEMCKRYATNESGGAKFCIEQTNKCIHGGLIHRLFYSKKDCMVGTLKAIGLINGVANMSPETLNTLLLVNINNQLTNLQYQQNQIFLHNLQHQH